MAQSLVALGTSNLPALDDRILAAIQQMEARLTQQFTQQLRASDRNAETRIVNYQTALKPEDAVEPLVAVADGADIPDFPQTVNDIVVMPGMYVDLSVLFSSYEAKRCCGIQINYFEE